MGVLHFTASRRLHFGTIPLNPTPDRGVVDRQTPLGHDLFQVPETQGKPAIPPQAGHDDDWFELPFAEQRRPTGDPIASPYQIRGCNTSGGTVRLDHGFG